MPDGRSGMIYKCTANPNGTSLFFQSAAYKLSKSGNHVYVLMACQWHTRILLGGRSLWFKDNFGAGPLEGSPLTCLWPGPLGQATG